MMMMMIIPSWLELKWSLENLSSSLEGLAR